MKTILALLFIIPVFALSQAKFTINGAVTGLPNGAEVKLTNTADNTEIAKAKSVNGKFTLAGSIQEPALYFIVLGSQQPQYIFLENKTINVSGNVDKIKELKITGSQSHQDFIVFKNTFNPLFGEMNGIAAEINKTMPGPRYDELMKKYDSVGILIQKEIDKFVTSKPSSFVSPFLLYVTSQVTDDAVAMDNRFSKLSEEIRQSNIGKSLAEQIAYNKVGAVGTQAIDFTQPDVEGKPVSLSSFKGKYVLVDFWASWCGPCRNENPNVVEAYNKFNNKNFTVLGVSLDQPNGKQKWLDAIAKDNLTWTHVSDLKFWNNEAAVLYHVQGIPFNFLIDPQGKIIGKNLRGPALEEKLCEVLGCN
jgi:peroxiredoxin